MIVASHDGVGEGELKADKCFSERSAGRIERESESEREDMKVSARLMRLGLMLKSVFSRGVMVKFIFN